MWCHAMTLIASVIDKGRRSEAQSPWPRYEVDTAGWSAAVDALAVHVAATARAGTTVLVKGSRFMRMERVVAALCGSVPGGAH